MIPYGDDRLIFCHPATENGMLLTDLRGGWYTHLRTQDEMGDCVCHYVGTRRAIAYEVLGRSDGVWSGRYDPASHRRYEFALPQSFAYTHTGHWPTFGRGQKSHFHPQISPDRKCILMTGGDPETETNHLYLVDIADLQETQGIPELSR